MPGEIVAPVQEVGSIVLSSPLTAVGLKRPAGGIVDPFLVWDTIQGTVTLSAPVGSAVGGGTRGFVIGTNLTVVSLTSQYGLVVGKGTAGAGVTASVRHVDDSGAVRWAAGILGSAGARDWVVYDLVAGLTRLAIDAATGFGKFYGSEWQVTPPAGGAITRIKAANASAVLYLDQNSVGGHASTIYLVNGVAKWGLGMGTGQGTLSYDFYNYMRPGLDGYIEPSVGTFVWLRPVVIGPSPLVVQSTSGAGMVRIGVGVDASYSAGQGFEFTFDAAGSGGYGANTAILNSFARGAGGGQRQLAIEASTLYLNNVSGGVVVVGVTIGGTGTLRVGGTGINATAYRINDRPFLDGSNVNYTMLIAPTGNNKILIGNALVPTIYYESETHSFFNSTAISELARLSSTFAAGETPLFLQLDTGVVTRVKLTAVGGAVPAGNRTLYV